MAADLVALLDGHSQTVDPNLRRLAEAAATAAGKLEAEGGEGCSGAEPPRPTDSGKGKSSKRAGNRGLDAVDKAMRAKALA